MTQSDASIECPHRDDCGACSLLGQSYAHQLEHKRRWLMEALDGVVDYDLRQVLPTLPSPAPEGYRNRAKMTISSDRDHHFTLGYFQRKSRQVVDAPHCKVLVPELLETTRELRKLMNSSDAFPFNLRHLDLRCGSDPGRQHLTLVVKSEKTPKLPVEAIQKACRHVTGVAVNLNPGAGPQVIKGPINPLAGEREVWVNCSGLSLRISAGSFFQVNLGLLHEIHSRMMSFLGTGRLLVDLFAGVGTHGFALREGFARVLCVEGVRSSVADARSIIKAARLRNVEMLANPVQRSLRRLQTERPDAFILNPSRVCAEAPVLETISRSSAARVVYLSCDPTTLARDLSLLMRGGFKLASIQAVDMMPQTKQVEAMALLSR